MKQLRKKCPARWTITLFTIHPHRCWLATADEHYRVATKLADAMIDRFFDRTAGAFYDTPAARWPGALAS